MGAAAIAFALVATLLFLLPALSPPAARADAQPLSRPTPTRVPGSCDATSTRSIDPNPVVAGDVATVTLFLRLDCAADNPFPLHLVLAVDDTTAMATPAGRDVLRALRGWVTSLPSYPKESTLSVGVVGYRTPRPRVRCPLSTRLDLARRCIDRLTGDGAGDVVDGIAAAFDVVKAGRPAGGDRDSIREVIVVVSGDGDGGRDGDAACQRAGEVAGVVRGQGVLLIVMSTGDSVGRRCLADVATSPRYYFALPGRPPSLARVREIVGTISRYGPDHRNWNRWHSVLDTLPVRTTFVDDGFDPAPNWVSERQAQWAMSYFPREGMTFTYQIRASDIGVIQMPERSWFDFEDDRHRRQSFMSPPVQLRVLSPFIAPLP
ncbi:MAG: hypothetical protein ABI780_04615 [Ardenticatenales bacterium]